MSRTIFFWIAAIISALFGLLMLFAPHVAANQFGMAGSADTNTIFRVLGATLLSIGLLNFLVRRDSPSSTLRAVLWTDVSIHAVGAVADIWSIVAGDITFGAEAIGFVSHAIIGLGALYCLWRMMSD